MNKQRYMCVFLLILILLIGVGIRIYKLSSHDLWFDEAVSIVSAERLVEGISVDKNPPLYFFLLHFWSTFFGKSEFALRFLSMIFGVTSIFMIYKIGKLLFDIRVGLVSAFIFSLSPIHIWYSQEARGYTLSVFTITLSVYFFILALKRNKVLFWTCFIVASIISLYSSYYYLLIIAGEFIVLLIKKYRYFIRKWVICNLFILFAFLPWSFFFLVQLRSIKEEFWIPKPNLKSILITFENFNVGFNATEATYFLATTLFLILLLHGILYCYKTDKENLIILSSFLFLPVIITFGISQWMPIYIDRQLILFSPFYYLIVAAGLTRIKRPSIQTMFLVTIFVLSTSSLYNYFLDFMPSPYIHHLGTYTKKPFKPVVRYIKEHYKEGDIIAHSNPATTVTFAYYWDAEVVDRYYSFGQRYFFIPSAQDRYWQWRFRRSLKEGYPGAIDLSQDIRQYNFKRIWLVSSSWARDGNLDQNSWAVREWLTNRYLAIDNKEFDGIFITLYVPKINEKS